MRGDHFAFGPLTRDALKRVQRDYGLYPTGKHGPRTRIALPRMRTRDANAVLTAIGGGRA